MVDRYLNSAAVGANDGTSKTDAWTAYSSVNISGSTDRLFIDDGHSDSSDNVIQGTSAGQGPVMVQICVDFAGSTPPVNADISTGAVLTASSTDYLISNSTYLEGFEIAGVRNVNINPGVGEVVVLKDMTLTSGNDDNLWMNGTSCVVNFYNLTYKGGGAAADNVGGFSIDSGGGAVYNFFGGQADSSLNWKDSIIFANNVQQRINFYGFDFTQYGLLSGTVNIQRGGAGWEPLVNFYNCKFPHGATTFGLGSDITGGGGRVECIGCGLVDNTSQEQGLIHDQFGTMEVWGGGLTGRAVYRSGGATPPHQTNPISWEVVPSSRCGLTNGFYLWPIMKYYATTGSTITIKVHYLAEDATTAVALDDSQIVLHIQYYDATGVLVGVEDSFSGVLSTLGGETNHAEETGETWTTTGVSGSDTLKLSVSHTTASTIAQEGFVRAILEVKDIGTNDSIFIDPKLEIT